MNFALCIFLFLLTAAVAGVAQVSASGNALTPLAQPLTAAEQNLIHAKMKDDQSFFKQNLAEDFTLVGVDGTLHEKQDAADELGDSSLLALSPYNIKVVALSDTAGIVSYDAVVREAPQEDQGPPPRYQHFSSVWVKQGEQWKLKFHQSTAAHWGDW
ncbi:MAG: nuclear transport factor 2 family protein [Candidatus Sulfotelmatobacter sp.]